jgi:fatty-acyl-CoA synthase
MACVVLAQGADATADDLEAHLGESFPDWWLPDEYQFVDAIPKTSTGKFDKMALRDRFDDVELPAE